MNLEQLRARGATVTCGAIDLDNVNLGRVTREGGVVLNEAGMAYVASAASDAEVAPVAAKKVAAKKVAAKKGAEQKVDVPADSGSADLDDLSDILGD